MNRYAKAEHKFFMATAVWYAITVFWGFAPSFYLAKFNEDYESLPKSLIIHGVIFTIWISLYVLQVFLIRSKNFKLHKLLGIFGLVVMIFMVPSGLFPVVYKVYAGWVPIDAAGHNVFRLCAGYLFFTLAFIYRKESFLHKRFILSCMVMLMSAAIFRISFDFGLEASQVFNKGLQVLPAVALFIFDLIYHRKLVFIDLLSVLAVFSIFLLADSFWLSTIGEKTMDALIYLFIKPFV
ncbi:hypothetical protein [Ekhidna sp.]|uniref:hypothetical protein n=1 Tax=Ekhidna sp. TaxID=2608089 RepID=UPI003C7B91E7